VVEALDDGRRHLRAPPRRDRSDRLQGQASNMMRRTARPPDVVAMTAGIASAGLESQATRSVIKPVRSGCR